jgi:hypothetical protein
MYVCMYLKKLKNGDLTTRSLYKKVKQIKFYLTRSICEDHKKKLNASQH